MIQPLSTCCSLFPFSHGNNESESVLYLGLPKQNPIGSISYLTVLAPIFMFYRLRDVASRLKQKLTGHACVYPDMSIPPVMVSFSQKGCFACQAWFPFLLLDGGRFWELWVKPHRSRGGSYNAMIQCSKKKWKTSGVIFVSFFPNCCHLPPHSVLLAMPLISTRFEKMTVGFGPRIHGCSPHRLRNYEQN